ncbi:VOC family protein [Halobacterium litoreum]|uniref:VOC family protein n=1 Tax=Halobacterium litoreum TaxID=2039234 RepID=A0ABD5NHV7_9EURY|nr:VOC family protein [Halobacterium litoreum]UHH12322.1 VOC family protein [Halobacterium litoreum]
MSGIVFFRTAEREAVVDFYRERLGFETWVDQDGCTILRHDDLKLGFCDGDESETEGIVTLYYDTREEVDAARERLDDVATDDPRENEQYDIYQFFGEDPEGRTLEFQTFLHDLPE